MVVKDHGTGDRARRILGLRTSRQAPPDADSGDAAAEADAVARLRRAALAHVMRHLTPLPYVVLGFPLLVSILFRRDIPGDRAAMWVALAVAAAASAFAVHNVYRRVPSTEDASRRLVVAVSGSLLLQGCVFGFSTWAVAGSVTEVVVLSTLFPAIAGSVAAVMCAGRTDLHLAFMAALVGSTAVGLLSSGNAHLRSLAIVTVFYGLAMVALHQMISASLISSLQAQARSEQLVIMLAQDQVALAEANEQLSTTNAQLVHLASHDPLTGLYNRRGTIESIDAKLAEAIAGGDGQPLALLFCDLDRFKAVNDSLGHRGGDQFLTVLADRIGRTIDANCIAGRIGGDEFVVALPAHDLARASAVANRLVGVLAQPVQAESREIPSSVSIGVAVYPLHGNTTSDLLRNANAALYHAKRSGRNRVELFDGDMQNERDAAIEAEQSLRRALDNGEILPFFQPEIDASSGRIIGAELLARWLRTDGTVMNAAEFISLAKRTGLLERLTERVLVQARPHIRRFASLGLPDGFRFRINLGPASTDRSWRDNPLDELVRGIDPSLLTVDVREAAVSHDLPAAAGTLASFRARGGRVCLDDFATGVSSLSLLRRLPIDEVRIDRQAIDTITAHPHDRAIVRSIIAVVREIGLAVTAEGVETGAQADALIALGCVRQQGHLYAPALPAESFEAFLLDRLAEGYVTTDAQSPVWDTGELA